MSNFKYKVTKVGDQCFVKYLFLLRGTWVSMGGCICAEAEIEKRLQRFVEDVIDAANG